MSSLHRAGWLVSGLLGISAAAAACAGSEDQPADLVSEDAGSGDHSVPDVVEVDANDAGTDATVVDIDACSSAGWCSLDVDSHLTFNDLWPLESGSIVAIASRDGRSQVVTYDSSSSWRIIYEVPFVLTSVWASGTDVWVSGAEPGYVAHGHRDSTGWTWNTRTIPVQTQVTRVWSPGDGEIYALADTRLWRLESEATDWVVDFGGDAPDPDLTLGAITGTTKDDLWLTGGRGNFPSCAFVRHKTAGTWEAVVEGTPDTEIFWPWTCKPVGSAPFFTGPAGIATATASREVVTFIEGFDSYFVARIRHAEDGTVDIATSTLANTYGYAVERTSIWGASADDIYISGYSKVNRGRNVWGDAGSWEISTVAFGGIALVKPFNVVRGTRSDDIWLAGESYVFHKTIQ